MPVFYAALDNASALNLPAELYKKIFSQIEYQRQKDGFVIKVLAPGKTVVIPANDVEPA